MICLVTGLTTKSSPADDVDSCGVLDAPHVFERNSDYYVPKGVEVEVAHSQGRPELVAASATSFTPVVSWDQKSLRRGVAASRTPIALPP